MLNLLVVNSTLLPLSEGIGKLLTKQAIVAFGATALGIGSKVAVHCGSKEIIKSIELNKRRNLVKKEMDDLFEDDFDEPVSNERMSLEDKLKYQMEKAERYNKCMGNLLKANM